MGRACSSPDRTTESYGIGRHFTAPICTSSSPSPASPSPPSRSSSSSTTRQQSARWPMSDRDQPFLRGGYCQVCRQVAHDRTLDYTDLASFFKQKVSTLKTWN